MGRCIIKLKGYYLIWSSIVDAPITHGMTIDELTEFIRDEYGNEGLRRLPNRLAKVEEYGTSAWPRYSVDALISLNRAGPSGSRLSKKQLYAQYCPAQEGDG